MTEATEPQTKTAEILAARFDGNPKFNRNPFSPTGSAPGACLSISFDLLIDSKWVATTRRMQDHEKNRVSTDRLISIGEYFGEMIRQYGCDGYTVTNGDCIRDYGNGVEWVEQRGGAQNWRDSTSAKGTMVALEVNQNDIYAVLGGIEQTLKGDQP